VRLGSKKELRVIVLQLLDIINLKIYDEKEEWNTTTFTLIIKGLRVDIFLNFINQK
jgi:hypothetical protein